MIKDSFPEVTLFKKSSKVAGPVALTITSFISKVVSTESTSNLSVGQGIKCWKKSALATLGEIRTMGNRPIVKTPQKIALFISFLLSRLRMDNNGSKASLAINVWL
jgi:hypothetical protein